jgi:hypothetical protein
VGGDEISERGGIARDFLGQFRAAVVEHVLEGLQARGQHLLDRLAAAVERLRESFGVLAETVGDAVAVRDHAVGDALAGLFQPRYHIAAARGDILDQRIAGCAQR